MKKMKEKRQHYCVSYIFASFNAAPKVAVLK